MKTSINYDDHASLCVFVCPPLLSVSVGLLVRRQLDDEHAGLSMLKAVLVVGCLWRALGVQHEDLGQKIKREKNGKMLDD